MRLLALRHDDTSGRRHRPGTIMRARTLRNYATAAGFSDVEVLSIENDFWRFYPLID